MFAFLDMLDDYESRKVARDEVEVEGYKVILSTARVTDSLNPYESAIWVEHETEVVVIKNYFSLESAQNGHKKILNELPKENIVEFISQLEDVGNSEISVFLRGGVVEDAFLNLLKESSNEDE